MKIEKDKILHFIVSFLLTIIFNFFFSLVLSIFFTFIIGVMKEIYDFFIMKRNDCLEDMVANLLGIMFAIFIIMLLVSIILITII